MVVKNAGMPATPEDLVDVDALIGAYYDAVPNSNIPEQRVIFGTSGHRGSALKTCLLYTSDAADDSTEV